MRLLLCIAPPTKTGFGSALLWLWLLIYTLLLIYSLLLTLSCIASASLPPNPLVVHRLRTATYIQIEVHIQLAHTLVHSIPSLPSSSLFSLHCCSPCLPSPLFFPWLEPRPKHAHLLYTILKQSLIAASTCTWLASDLPERPQTYA